MPELESSIWSQYEGEGVLVFAIHPGDPPEQIAAFVEQTGITFPVVADEGTVTEFVFPQGVGYPYPRDVIIGKDLTVRSISNSFNPAHTEQLIEQLLDE